MSVLRSDIADVLMLEPKVYRDPRGFFLESYNRRTFHASTGLDVDFVQDNQSFSVRNVLRGLHYQVRQPQGKLVQVAAGEIFDVAVDLRRTSPTFGKWVGVNLSGTAHRSLWIPPGFAHGFIVRSEHAIVLYKTTDYYAPEHERTIVWNDESLAIRWPLDGPPILSDKDRHGAAFRAAEVFD
jgi:dTDP-4-dehydrorhamnose 3,5-epimerase